MDGVGTSGWVGKIVFGKSIFALRDLWFKYIIEMVVKKYIRLYN
jgi:hypothetical protein